MRIIIVFSLTFLCIVSILVGCSKQEAIGGSNDANAVIPIEANEIKIIHEKEKDTSDFIVIITDATEIDHILDLYNSMKIRQISKPLNIEKFIITFYHNNTEIAVWWVDKELTTACSGFEGGNYVIENKDFNYSYFESAMQ